MSYDQDQNDRFAALELDLDLAPFEANPATVPSPIPTPVKAEASEPTPLVSTFDHTVVSQESADLVSKEQEIASRHGLAGGETWYADGTALAESGQAYARREAEAYDKLPNAYDAAVAHQAVIASELRRDVPITLRECKLDMFGELQTPGGSLEIGPAAWSRIVAEAPKDARIPANVNSWIGQIPHKSRIARTRTVGALSEAREVYALVSHKYAPLDSDRVLMQVARAMPGCKADVEYDADTTRMRARVYVQAPVDVAAFNGVGRVHQAGVQVTTRDDGLGSLQVEGFLMRIRCLNHSLSTTNTAVRRKKHMGATADLQRSIQQVIGTLPELIEEMRALWTRSAAEHYVDSASGGRISVSEAVSRMIHFKHLPTCGLSADDAHDRYMDAWRAEESVYSAAGIVMAVQRAAHEGSWRTRWADEEIETAAGELLSRTSWALPEIKDEA